MFQSGVEPGQPEQEIRQDLPALAGVDDLGMELDAEEAPRPGFSMTATRVLAVRPVIRKPGGSLSSRSPWLIQT